MSFSKKGSCVPSTATTAATTTTNRVKAEKLSPVRYTSSPKVSVKSRVNAIESRGVSVLRDISNVPPSAANSALPDASPKIPAFIRLYEQGTNKIRNLRSPKSEPKKALLPSKPSPTKLSPRPSPKNNAVQVSTPVQTVSTPEIHTPVSPLQKNNNSELQAVQTQTPVEVSPSQSTPSLQLATILQMIQRGITHYQVFERIAQELMEANRNAPSTLPQAVGFSQMARSMIREMDEGIEVLSREIDELERKCNGSNNGNNNDNDNISSIHNDNDNESNSNNGNNSRIHNDNDNSKEDQTVVPTSSGIKETSPLSRSGTKEVVEPFTGFRQAAFNNCSSDDNQDRSHNDHDNDSLNSEPEQNKPLDDASLGANEPITRFHQIASKPNAVTTVLDENAEEVNTEEDIAIIEEDVAFEKTTDSDFQSPSFFDLLDELEKERLANEREESKQRIQESEEFILKYFTEHIPDPMHPCIIRKPRWMIQEEIFQIKEYGAWLRERHAKSREERREEKENREEAYAKCDKKLAAVYALREEMLREYDAILAKCK